MVQTEIGSFLVTLPGLLRTLRNKAVENIVREKKGENADIQYFLLFYPTMFAIFLESISFLARVFLEKTRGNAIA